MTFTPYVCKIFFFTLKFLSVILCFSGLCFDKASGLLCGLTPFAFVTVSSPHLGVKLLMGRAATWIKDTFSNLNTPSVQDLFLDKRTDYLFLNPEEVKEDGALPKQVGAKEPSEPAPLLLEMTRKVVLNEQASGSFSVSNSLFFVVFVLLPESSDSVVRGPCSLPFKMCLRKCSQRYSCAVRDWRHICSCC